MKTDGLSDGGPSLDPCGIRGTIKGDSSSSAQFWFVATLILIWYEYRFIIALIAFAAYWAFSKITFRVYFKREILQTAREVFDMTKEQCAQAHQPFDADEQWQQSLNSARSMVLSNMSGKRLGE